MYSILCEAELHIASPSMITIETKNARAAEYLGRRRVIGGCGGIGDDGEACGKGIVEAS